jgi:hypothetical protein
MMQHWCTPCAAPNAGTSRHAGADKEKLERALKLQNYFTQPFFIAEPYTRRPGATVAAAEALRTCREILDGHYDDLPVDAFFSAAASGKSVGMSSVFSRSVQSPVEFWMGDLALPVPELKGLDCGRASRG